MNEWLENLRRFGSQNLGLSSYDLWVSASFKRRAAVLILLYMDEVVDELFVVITTRSSKLRTFPGQAAFPGGRSDFENELPWDTALREAREEIGFDSSEFNFEKLCNLPVYMSANKLVVLPMVGFVKTKNQQPIKLEDLAPMISDDEVQYVYSLRVSQLYTELHYSTQLMDWNDRQWYYHIFRVPFSIKSGNKVITVPGEKITKRFGDVEGLTANMLLDCVRVASGKDPESFKHLPDIGYEKMVRIAMNI